MKENKIIENCDDKMVALFDVYHPDLKSRDLFMKRLETSIKAVEPVKARIESDHRINRMVALAAAVTGFIFGIIVAVFFPEISLLVKSAVISLKITEADKYVTSATWTLISITGMILVYFASDITRILSLQFHPVAKE